MVHFWRNPEFVRHARAELRAPRAMTAAVLALIVAALVGLSCWSAEDKNARQFLFLFHCWLLGIQFAVLALGCSSANGQAISRERQLKTYDFLRTTRLTAWELMVGKILGAPLMTYFVIACSLPISLMTGFLGGVSPGVLIWDVILMVFLALFVGLVALWFSMLVERPSSGFAAVALLALTFYPAVFALSQSAFTGFGALALIPSIFSLYRVPFPISIPGPAAFLGLPVSLPAMTVLLYCLIGAWFALMLARNLKKDREQVRLLSRWQAVGLAAFLNLLFFALLDSHQLRAGGGYGQLNPQDVSQIAVVLNACILFLIGLATITPPEKLKIWWRRRSSGQESYFSEYGLPWPWLVPAALVAYGLLVAEATGLRTSFAIREWHLDAAALELFVILVFVTRDVLFLQWCNLTRMKRPLVKGFLYLSLYYAAVGTLTLVAGVIEGEFARYPAALTPFYVFVANVREQAGSSARLPALQDPAIYTGLALQIPAIAMLLGAIPSWLLRPAVPPPAAPVPAPTGKLTTKSW